MLLSKMSIFKGDKPAAQFEAGQQKGGNIKSLSYIKVTLHVTAEQNRSFTSVSGFKRKIKFMTIKAF